MGARVTKPVRSLDIVELHVVGQALEDILRYELDLPLEGVKSTVLLYCETLFFLQKQYPVVYQRWEQIPCKLTWLREIEYARQ